MLFAPSLAGSSLVSVVPPWSRLSSSEVGTFWKLRFPSFAFFPLLAGSDSRGFSRRPPFKAFRLLLLTPRGLSLLRNPFCVFLFRDILFFYFVVLFYRVVLCSSSLGPSVCQSVGHRLFYSVPSRPIVIFINEHYERVVISLNGLIWTSINIPLYLFFRFQFSFSLALSIPDIKITGIHSV